ncbi:unnamed protein product [Owenia fusiformis]|uniref:UDP-N-acetylglucosamine transferase subunit ALG13 n=1 Tax=Owenia fusiformis TaxID=6347 RepID=A0A8S4PDC1_OWEFU|nr:unnamed protein product [Owenia fusiformis]
MQVNEESFKVTSYSREGIGYQGNMPGNYVFVTVGTTSFDDLIKSVCQPKTCQILNKGGYGKLLLQVGRGDYEPQADMISGLNIEHYRYKDSIADDIKHASLVISHAGAGSVFEALGAERPLIVVINEKLMGNHQVELAAQLQEDNHLYYTTCSNLQQCLKTMDLKTLVPYTPGTPETFRNYLDKIMGFKT